MFNRSLSSFVPPVYKDVVEMDDIIEAEEKVTNIARTEMSTAFANTFVLTANESGVIIFENMLGIVPNTQMEDLQFRKQRILSRLSTNLPFTFRYLKQKLDEIIGSGAWTARVDFSTYTLYVEASADNQNWYSEIEFTINRIKPCNMVFVNVPYTAPGMRISEQVSYSISDWMYRLGSWRLGRYPFSTFREGGIIKMATVDSLQPALLNGTANFVNGEISYVLLNDSVKITTFNTKQVSANIVQLEYSVTPEMLTLITDIKLMRADDTVLTRASVYVPVTQTVVSKHIITVKEGA